MFRYVFILSNTFMYLLCCLLLRAGHTLRLLAFPEFLNSLVTKLIALKSRLSGAIALLQVCVPSRYHTHSLLPVHTLTFCIDLFI